MSFDSSCYSQQHFFTLWEFMLPLTQVFVWRLSVALQLNYNIHPEYFSETQGWNFLKVQLCIRFGSWDLKANHNSAEKQELEEGKTAWNRIKWGKGGLGLSGPGDKVKKLSRGCWRGNLRIVKQSKWHGRRKDMFFLKQWSRSQNWLSEMRMRSPGRRRRGLKVGQAGTSTQYIRLVGGRGEDLCCFPWSGASQTDLCSCQCT